MSKIKLESNPSGTGTFTIQSPASSTDRTLTLPDGAGEILLSDGDGSNLTGLPSYSTSGSCFFARLSSDQTISHATWTKLPMSAEDFDAESDYDTSTYKFQPTVAGYYQCTLQTRWWPPNNYEHMFMNSVYKNGSQHRVFRFSQDSSSGREMDFALNCVVYLNGTTDYIEPYAYQWDYTANGSVTLFASSLDTFFNCYLIRAA